MKLILEQQYMMPVLHSQYWSPKLEYSYSSIRRIEKRYWWLNARSVISSINAVLYAVLNPSMLLHWKWVYRYVTLWSLKRSITFFLWQTSTRTLFIGCHNDLETTFIPLWLGRLPRNEYPMTRFGGRQVTWGLRVSIWWEEIVQVSTELLHHLKD